MYCQKPTLSSCITKDLLNIKCDSCTVEPDSLTTPTKICAGVDTQVGGQSFRSCWTSDTNITTYGGDFKICFCPSGANCSGAGGDPDLDGASGSPNHSQDAPFDPVSKCDTDGECGAAGKCRGGGTGGTCSTGTCS